MKYPEINLMGDGMRVKIITDNVEVYVYSENGNLMIVHPDLSPFLFKISDEQKNRLVKKLEIIR